MPQSTVIHYLMMGMEREQVIGQLGITLEVDLYSVGPGASKTLVSSAAVFSCGHLL